MRSATTLRRVLEFGVMGLLLIGSMGCEGQVDARFKILSDEGSPLSDALVSHQMTEDHDVSGFTGEQGCAHLLGLVAPHGQVAVTIEKSGYRSVRVEAANSKSECFIVHLAPDEGHDESSAMPVPLEECPCAVGDGYSPYMSARFKVSSRDGTDLELVEVRRSDAPRRPWVEVTDETGCVGLDWVVPAHLERLPLVLEKSGFQTAYVEVPTMEDRCYSIVLSRVEADTASGVVTSIVSVSEDECRCEISSGRRKWSEDRGGR